MPAFNSFHNPSLSPSRSISVPPPNLKIEVSSSYATEPRRGPYAMSPMKSYLHVWRWISELIMELQTCRQHDLRKEADPLGEINLAAVNLQSFHELRRTSRDDRLVLFQRMGIEGTIPRPAASCMFYGILTRNERRFLMLNPTLHSESLGHAIGPHERKNS
jgi:hypothetical protein